MSFYPSFVTQDLVGSELFGHQKGAFTGATEPRVGLIEEANGGTLFVDEVADLPLETQVLMLRVLQDKQFRRIGSNKEFASDFRLISATNKDIRKMAAEDKFRKDFYHRVSHLEIDIPPLRERREDIPMLADLFLQTITARERLNVTLFEQDVISKLVAHHWPGNVRELQACVEACVYRANYNGHRRVETSDLQLGNKPMNLSDSEMGSFREKIGRYESKLVQEALAAHNGNQTKAAQSLQLDRSSFRRILEREKK